MKKLVNHIILIILLFSTFGLSFVSCSDFLNRPPYDQFDDEEFWKSEDQARAFMYAVYPTIFPGYGSGTTDPTTFYFETSNDDYMSSVAQSELGPVEIPTSDGNWSFTNVRKANYILENVDRLDADSATINHWRGIGRFFRAVFYSNLVFLYGDVPYLDHVPVSSNSKQDLDYLYKDRDPRTYVDDRIMEDLRLKSKRQFV